MPKLLQPLDSQKYEIGDSIWTELTTEIQSIRQRLNDGAEMQPEDFTRVKTLSAQVKNYGEGYRKAITAQAKDYKAKLDKELADIGYGDIETYLATKRTEQQLAISTRLNNKLDTFNGLVLAELNTTTYLRTSAIVSMVANNLAKRFPKLNSGAESKEITNWAPITSVIHMSIAAVENVFVQYPIMTRLPAQSQTLRTIAQYLETGSAPLIENMKSILETDMDLLQRLALQERVKTNAATVSEIEGIMASNDTDELKIQHIKTILNVYDTLPH